MTELTPEDIAAARAEGEGEVVALLLLAAGLPVNVPKQRVSKPAVPSDNVHISHPGAWPTGTSRPAPVPAPPGPQIEAALADYRRWLVADRPHASTNCPCPGCTPEGSR
ncbi:hypothetical protein ADK53_28615 [Streptomyces sp. WM6373]|uniref:hypothetical protein n=1 Tax=Streptomyces sp. WM6373 TaxID=1415556 RepID=UPI0006AE2C88|nr:hypothetical protein [Streptomyces sp. WM6373]KOU30185.1 hypothetical protein ADK53_28615 [Streptomyces sp. WM6373]